MLLNSDSCHSCFACQLQTVHPIPVIFISISTEIISSIQRHTWFAKIMPGSSFPCPCTHMHCISHPAYHAMFCIMLLAHCIVIDGCPLCLCYCLGRAGRRVRERGTCLLAALADRSPRRPRRRPAAARRPPPRSPPAAARRGRLPQARGLPPPAPD